MQTIYACMDTIACGPGRRRDVVAAHRRGGAQRSEMATTLEIRFYSQGKALAGTLKLPDVGGGPFPAVVQGPGWLGLRGARLYHPYHEGLIAAGIAVLVFDYRGFGDSEGDASYLDPMSQVEDYRSAVTYLESRPDIDADAHRRLRVRGHRWRQRDLCRRPRSPDQGRRGPGARSPTVATGSTGCVASTSGSSSSSGSAMTASSHAETGESGDGRRRETGSWSRRPSAGRPR